MKKSILTAASMLATILAMAQDGQPAQTQMPENVAYFEYNMTFVVENFNDEPIEINVVGDPEDVKQLRSLLDDETVSAAPAPPVTGFWARMFAPKSTFKITLKPHSYKAYSY